MTLDELLLEWSYRSERGYPTLDNPSDVSVLKEILTYTLGGGKRLRPILALVISKMINNNIDISKLAISIELFHNASLILL